MNMSNKIYKNLRNRYFILIFVLIIVFICDTSKILACYLVTYNDNKNLLEVNDNTYINENINISSDNKNIFTIMKTNNIKKLLDKRAEIIIKKLTINNTNDLSNSADNDLNNVEKALNNYGVKFLSTKEVIDMFPQVQKFFTDEILNYNYNIENNNNTVIPNIAKPQTLNTTWSTYRISNYYYKGKYYNIQMLIAQPNTSQSCLYNFGTRIINFDYNWKAGTYNVIESLAWSTAGSIPGASSAINFYDAISSFISGIDKTTEVKVPHIAYTWSSVTTVAFAFVRLENQSDDYQRLCHISSKAITEVRYSIPKLEYRKNNNGQYISIPKVISDAKTIHSEPNKYHFVYDAVYAYNNLGSPKKEMVEKIKISGPEYKTVEYIYPFCPMAIGELN